MAKKKKEIDIKLTDKIDPVADEKARQRILEARIGLVLRHGFFGNLAMRLKLVNADSWLTTAATDGRHFYYNTQFINMLNARQNMFLFCHELLHCAYGHVGKANRGEGRIHKIANIAMDYVVNADCIKHSLGEKITQVPLLYDKKYEGWSFEQVYDDLMKNVQTIDMDELMEMLLDDHLDDNEGNGEGKGGEGDKEGKGRPKLSREQLEELRNEFREKMVTAAQAAGAGNLPSNLTRMIKDLTEPRINWRDMIQQQIQSTIKNDYTYAIPARKNFANGFSMPSMRRDEAIEVCVGIDTSGSISQEQLKDFYSEIQGIMDSYDSYKIKVWSFDTSVHKPADFSSDDVKDITEYEAGGFGGTDFEANWNWMKAEGIEPKMLIIFTDGMPFGSWGDPDYCDTCWIINNDYNKGIEPPFGRYAYYEK